MTDHSPQPLTKAQRELLRLRFDGRCAYCGCDLGHRWHADHFEPIIRNSSFAGRGPLHPERDHLDNMMPACARCNISKGRQSLESWRGWLSGHVNSLNQYSTPYKLAKAYGLINETNIEVVFYFERVGRTALASSKTGDGP